MTDPKRALVFIVLFFMVGTLSAQEKTDGGSVALRVISYNIWNGFEWGKAGERKQNAIAWINSQKPDVVALQELNGYTREALLEDAREWGHSYAEIVKTAGYPVGLTSNKPIEVKERILENMHHGALHCTTWDIDFIVVHFSPFSYQKRQEEAQIVLSKLADIKEQQDKIIVLGDFNAVSPFDAQFYKDNAELLITKRESEKENAHVRNLLMGQLEYGVLGTFLGFPLIDVVQKHTTTFEERLSCPTQVFEKDTNKERPANATRIDYIMASPFLGKHCTYARVQNKEPTYRLSDHYPVIAEFKW